MNTVVLMGRITRDPDLRYLQTSGNTAVARFTVAVDKQLSKEKRQELESRNQPTADFISCVAWGKLAENLAKYSGKGLRVVVEGRIQTGSYEKDGQRVYTTDVLASNIQYIDWKDSNSSNTGYSNQSSSSDDFNPINNFEYSADFDPIDDNRIPF